MIPEPAAKYIAPRDNPLSYPGLRPNFSYLLARETVFPLTMEDASTGNRDFQKNMGIILDQTESVSGINDFFKEIKAPGIGERYAVVGYGSNSSPGQLTSKLGKNAVVPVLFGKLLNTELVYNLISNLGYAYAEILTNQNQINAPIGITFLDDEQFEKVTKTERNYKIGICNADIILDSGHRIAPEKTKSIYLFAGKNKIWVPAKIGHPVPIKELPSSGRKNEALNQEQTLEVAIEDFELNKFGIFTPEQFSRKLREESSLPDEHPKLKFVIQDSINNNPNSLPAPSASITIVENENELKYFAL